MFFKLSTAFVTAALAATLAVSTPLERRQDICEGAEIVSCTLTATASGVPDTTVEPLTTEWNFLFGRNYAANLPSSVDPVACGSTSANSTVTGPVSGVFTITNAVGNPELTAAQSSAVVQATFNAATFPGPWSGVTWTIGSVTCDA